MNDRRRVVACVALGAALTVVTVAVNQLLAPTSEDGWFMYQPNAEPIFSPASPDWPIIRDGIPSGW